MKLFLAALACAISPALATVVKPWTCPLTNCALKSPLASAGPGFADGVRFFSMGSGAQDTRVACPFSDNDDGSPPVSKKEYLKYMREMTKVSEMPIEERRAYALKHQQEMLENHVPPELREANSNYNKKEDAIDVTAPGAEAVTRSQWSALRRQNKHDLLIVFYAPWCPHCKLFVTSENAPINALDASLERVSGPKVVKFDVQANTAPEELGLEGVPTLYLFKKTGEAMQYKGDISAKNMEGLMNFALDKPVSAPKAQALVEKKVTTHSHEQKVPAWTCPLTNCVLKSPLASAGPAFADGVHFFATGIAGQDTRAACPFGGDEGPPPTKKEYMKYMGAMDRIGDMSYEERRKWAIDNQEAILNAPVVERKIKDPTVDVTAPGIEALNSTTWSELRNANKFDFLITFYAPWCPHCKAFVTSENAPLKALSATLEKVNGPKVVTFDMVASTPPLVIDAVPTIYLFKKTGEAVPFEEDTSNLEALAAFALNNASPAAQALVQKTVSRHLRKTAAAAVEEPPKPYAEPNAKDGLQSQGFSGKKVSHVDGETAVSDWGKEYGHEHSSKHHSGSMRLWQPHALMLAVGALSLAFAA